MEAVGLTCPNCGGGLGAPEGGVYLCGYCAHRSLPAALGFDPAERAASLAAALAEFEARRARPAGARDELRRRQREALARGRRVNAFLMLGLGALFLLFAVACGALAVISEAGLGVVSFGGFWLVLGGMLLGIGRRYSRSHAREQRLREQGTRGRATILSFKDLRMMVDGAPRYELVLRVEVPGAEAYSVRQIDNVQKSEVLSTGGDVPVLVSPTDRMDVLVDWFAA